MASLTARVPARATQLHAGPGEAHTGAGRGNGVGAGAVPAMDRHRCDGDGNGSDRACTAGAPASRCVVAVIANRAREVGVAALDCDTMRLSLNQIIEPSRVLGTTSALIDSHAPSTLLVPADGSAGAQHQTHLAGLLERCASLRAIALAMKRSAFDDTRGWELVATLAVEPIERAHAEKHSAWYLALGAAHAVAQFAQVELGVDLFQPDAGQLVTINFDTLRAHMVIDRTTLAELEVITPITTVASNAQTHKGGERSAAASSGTTPPCATLFQLMGSQLVTAGGKRLLRANLLQPLRDHSTLVTRQDAVAELLEMPELHQALVTAISRCPSDADTVVARLAAPPPRAGTQVSQAALSARLSDLLKVKSAVRCAPVLAKAFAVVFPMASDHRQQGHQQSDPTVGTSGGAEHGGAPRSALLRALASVFCDPHGTLRKLSERIDEQVEDDALHAKQSFQSQVQCIYAMKQGADGLLDLARQLFSETTEQIHEAAQRYRAETGLRTLKLPYDQRRGFYLKVSAKELRDCQTARRQEMMESPPRAPSGSGGEFGGPQGRDADMPEAEEYGKIGDSPARDREGAVLDEWGDSLLPPGFVNSSTRGTTVQCTTHELMQLNARMMEAKHNALQRSVAAATQLLEAVRSAARPLCQLAEAMNLLDLLVNSLAVVSREQGYCRPTLLDASDAPLAIRRARHPVLSALDIFSYVPNSVLLTPQTRLLILCGPNAAGKTTYLRALCLCTLMAHIGCWVPAESASVRLTDRMLTRLGVDDCLESNASSFSLEMKEVAYCLHNLSDRALVVIDELGRATSDADSLAISWAVGEALMGSGAYSAMATHEHRLARLQHLYPGALCASMAVRAEGGTLDFCYEISDGLSAEVTSSHYGLLLAEAIGFPHSVVASARAIADAVGEARATRELRAEQRARTDCEDARRTLKFEAARRLAGLKYAADHIPREQLLRCLATVRRALCEGLEALPH